MALRLTELLTIAGQASSLGPIVGKKFYGIPQWRFQYAVVGDALVMTQKYDAKVKHATQIGLLEGAVMVSKALFEAGVPHRGAVSVGKVMCKLDNRAAIITGEAVLRAYFLESKIKTLGLYLDVSCEEFCRWYRVHTKRKLNFQSLKGWKSCLAVNPWSPIKAKGILVGTQGQQAALKEYCEKNKRGKKVFRTKTLLNACSLF